MRFEFTDTASSTLTPTNLQATLPSKGKDNWWKQLLNEEGLFESLIISSHFRPALRRESM